MPYLLKSEPDQYSFEDLQRDGETLWDGVANPVALRHLGEMKAGDKLIYYHTGKERQAVGTASVASVDDSDPKIPKVKSKGREATCPTEAAGRDQSAEAVFRLAFDESGTAFRGAFNGGAIPLAHRQLAVGRAGGLPPSSRLLFSWLRSSAGVTDNCSCCRFTLR